MSSSKFSARVITYSAMAITIATVLSMLKLFRLPMGGSVTLCSFLFLILPAYWFGPICGIVCGVIAGLIEFIIMPIALHPVQVLLDYIFAYGAASAGGFFRHQKNSLMKGFLTAAFLKFVFHFLSGIVFFRVYAPENMNVAFYSFVYNFPCIFIEVILSLIVINIKSFRALVDKIFAEHL